MLLDESHIDHAASLLRTTPLSVDAVASRVGYPNGSTLRDVVRRRRGMTIRELRAGPTPVRRSGDGTACAPGTSDRERTPA